jgi:hypothetical protein
MQIASDQMESQRQPLQTPTVPLLAGDSFWTQNEDLIQFNQQTVLSPTFYAHFSAVNNQGSQHTRLGKNSLISGIDSIDARIVRYRY